MTEYQFTSTLILGAVLASIVHIGLIAMFDGVLLPYPACLP